MSNHFSADYLKSPGDDRRLDITDVFVFKSSKDPDKIILIANSNPTAPAPAPVQARGPEFYPGAVYRINVDTDGDAHADIAFTLTFSDYQDGTQTGTIWHATGPEARQPEPAGQILAESFPVNFDGMAAPIQAGPIRLLAGRRSDPFFADVEGTLHGFTWTGHDDYAGNNVSSITLEVPADMLFTGPQTGVWATISRRRADGTLEQMDRGGNPTLNPFINPDGQKDLYNSRQPADDVANYLEAWSAILEKAGYPPKTPARPPSKYCPTSCASTAPSPPSTPTAAGPSKTSTATASPGSATAKSPRKASSRTPTCSPTSPTSAPPAPNHHTPPSRAGDLTGPAVGAKVHLADRIASREVAPPAVSAHAAGGAVRRSTNET
jgi:Domain of unknown function (DUF4331)